MLDLQPDGPCLGPLVARCEEIAIRSHGPPEVAREFSRHMPNSPALPYDDKPREVIVASLARHKEEANRQHHYPRPHARNPTRLPRSGAFHHVGTAELATVNFREFLFHALR